jgi:hypothetical protein
VNLRLKYDGIMDKDKVQKAIKRKQLEENLKQYFLATLDERISRYQELDFIKITPNAHFASVSAECILLYRDGHFLACIALCQAVAEAIVRLMCERSKFSSISNDYEKNVEKLYKRNIKPDCNELFKEIWKSRNEYHHLNPEIPIEKNELHELAKSKILTLHRIESTVFEFTIINGTISPKYLKYWDVKEDGLLNVFLRFEP